MANANLKYIASGYPKAEFSFQASLVKTRSANFHEYSWNPDAFQFDYGAQVLRFGKDPITYSATIYVNGSESSKRAWLDEFHLRCDLDIKNNTPGRLYWGDMYLECFIIETSTAPMEGNVTVENEIGIYAPYPSWIYQETYARSTYFGKEQVEKILGNLNNMDVPYEPGKITITDDLNISAPFTPLRSSFRAMLIGDGTSTAASMTIEGDDADPAEKVVMDFPLVTLASGQALVVDSRHGRKTANTYTVVDWDQWPGNVPYTDMATEQNVYGLRAANSRPFREIKFGYNTPYFELKDAYSLTGTRMILTVYYERSEPTWIS